MTTTQDIIRKLDITEERRKTLTGLNMFRCSIIIFACLTELGLFSVGYPQAAIAVWLYIIFPLFLPDLFLATVALGRDLWWLIEIFHE